MVMKARHVEKYYDLMDFGLSVRFLHSVCASKDAERRL